jgi:dolichyl-phosphate beta-glucosyltransferase
LVSLRTSPVVVALTRVAAHLGVILVFTVPAVALWWHAWSGGAGSTIRCLCLDPGQQVWFVAWPAYAISHGLNPVSSTWLWPPHGVNLLSNASATLAGVVLAPVTWIFGPFVSTTVALTLAPGLSGWGCWLACRRVVSWVPACWVAGFLFGYSPFVVASVTQGHLSGGLLVIPPLIFVVLHEILVRQQWRPVWCGIALALLLTAQFFISAEILAMTVITAVVGVIVTAVVAPRRAATAVPFAATAFVMAAAVTAVLLAAPVWYMTDGPEAIKGAIWSGTQVLSVSMLFHLWTAGPYRAAPVGFPRGSGGGPPLEFLGLGVLVAAGLSLLMAWRRRAAWVVAAVAVFMTACSWGGAIFLGPHHLVHAGWLPWPLVWMRPLFDNILPDHFAALVDLAVAILVAIGLDAAHRWSFWKRVPAVGCALVVLAVAATMLIPWWRTYGAPVAVQKVVVPSWFKTAARGVAPGSVVVSYPFPASAALRSQPMDWQAADDMRVRLAGGYVKVPGPGKGVIGLGPPDSATNVLDILSLVGGSPDVTVPRLLNLRSALENWKTTYIVVTDTGHAPVQAAALFTAATGMLPQISHRAWVWHLTGRSLGTPSAATAASFRTCQLPAPRLGDVPANQPLPQAVNACIAAAARF